MMKHELTLNCFCWNGARHSNSKEVKVNTPTNRNAATDATRDATEIQKQNPTTCVHILSESPSILF